MNIQADIGVFGGSGFYTFLDNVDEIDIETPYGKTSDKITLGEIYGKKVAFLPRHGKQHTYPPHMVPYKANMDAMRQLGVKKIIGPTACGSLQPYIKPGDFVVCDQFVDRTWGRSDTYIEWPVSRHVSAAEPYCSELRELAINACKKMDVTVHEKGTVVVIQGPRFSTRAESRWFSKMGWEVINMTQYPEAYLARELGICYVNISLITDFDAGVEGNEAIKPVTENEVLRVFQENNEKVKKVILEMIKNMNIEPNCGCKE